MKISPKELARAFYAAAADAEEKDLPKLAKSFVATVKARGLLALLPGALAALPAAAEAGAAAKRVTVTTAHEVDDDLVLAALEAAGISPEGRDIVHVDDPKVIGGIKIKTHDTVIDATVAKALTDLKSQFQR